MADTYAAVMTDEEFAALLEDPNVLLFVWLVRELVYEAQMTRDAETADASR
jgi:hypothetical protein